MGNTKQNSAGDASLGVLDRVQPLLLVAAIAIGLLLASMVPEFARRLEPLVTVGVFLVIFFIMLGVDIQGVLRAFRDWKVTGLAMGINFVITPMLAWLLGYVFLRNESDVWAGLILYLVTPCIGWYLVFTELAKGDVELGVSLLFWNVILQILLIPVYMGLLAGTIVHVSISEMLKSVAVFLVLPLALARLGRMVLSKRSLSFKAVQQQFHLDYVKTIVLMFVIAAMFASQGGVLFKNPFILISMIVPGLLFFSIVLMIALIAGKLFKLPYRKVALLVFTTTSRNSEASLAVAVTAFASRPLIALTVVIGPSIELVVLILILRLILWIREKAWYVS